MAKKAQKPTKNPEPKQEVPLNMTSEQVRGRLQECIYCRKSYLHPCGTPAAAADCTNVKFSSPR